MLLKNTKAIMPMLGCSQRVLHIWCLKCSWQIQFIKLINVPHKTCIMNTYKYLINMYRFFFGGGGDQDKYKVQEVCHPSHHEHAGDKSQQRKEPPSSLRLSPSSLSSSLLTHSLSLSLYTTRREMRIRRKRRPKYFDAPWRTCTRNNATVCQLSQYHLSLESKTLVMKSGLTNQTKPNRCLSVKKTEQNQIKINRHFH